MSTDAVARRLADEISDIRLVDHHVHGVVAEPSSRGEFEEMITESNRPVPGGSSTFDSQLGYAIRRWCAPVLGLDAHAPAETYLARRAELGGDEVTRRLLQSSRVETYLVDTGHHGAALMPDAQMGALAGATVREVVRLESIAERVVHGTSAADFAAAFDAELTRATATAVGVKSIVAYRTGLDIDPEPPSSRLVESAASAWLRTIEETGQVRLSDPVLERFVLWRGIERGLPLQLHTGFGDPDVDLRWADPLLLRDFIELAEPTGTPIVLLHCYPFHRHAGYLAHAYPTVYFDVGLALNYVGARAAAVFAESIELAPFHKVLFSSDAWGLAELHYLGAQQWRRSATQVFGDFVTRGEWSLDDALRVTRAMGRDSAIALYGLDAAR